MIFTGKFHGQRSLAGYGPQGCKESDTTEWLSLFHMSKPQEWCFVTCEFTPASDSSGTVTFWHQPGDSDGKEPACSAGGLGLIPGSGRSPGGEYGNPLQYSCLENPMGRGTWQATVHGVTKSCTWLTEWLNTGSIHLKYKLGKWMILKYMAEVLTLRCFLSSWETKYYIKRMDLVRI